MKPGEGPGKFLGDLANKVSDEVMRQRYREGHYGTGLDAPKAEYVAGWRKQDGRG